MKDSIKLKLVFNADDATAALEAAVRAGMLCGTCAHKVETNDEMSQSDFCSACEASISSQLGLIVVRRMKEVLARIGLPLNSVAIMEDIMKN